MRIPLAQIGISSILLISAAFAADTRPTATLKAPSSVTTDEIADDVIWHCAGTACAPISAGEVKVSVRSCREVAKTYGPVVAFGTPMKQLSASDIQDCNS